MSADETLFTVTKGRESIIHQGEYYWTVSGANEVLILRDEVSAKAVAWALTKRWTCKAPDGKKTCPYAKYCKFERQRIQILGNQRGEDCPFYVGFAQKETAQ